LRIEVSIHAFRGEGDRCCDVGIRRVWAVSIHAFRGEGDNRQQRVVEPRHIVSIHAFRGEGDLGVLTDEGRGWVFQSTPSGGKAT